MSGEFSQKAQRWPSKESPLITPGHLRKLKTLWPIRIYFTLLLFAFHVSYWLNLLLFRFPKAIGDTLNWIEWRLVLHFPFSRGSRRNLTVWWNTIAALPIFLLHLLYSRATLDAIVRWPVEMRSNTLAVSKGQEDLQAASKNLKFPFKATGRVKNCLTVQYHISYPNLFNHTILSQI
jgi:hypothetical protein